MQILVQARQPELPPLLADLLGKRHQDAEAGGIDVAGTREVDDELAGARLDRVEDLLLQVLAVPDDELAVHADDYDSALVLVHAEAHPRSSA